MAVFSSILAIAPYSSAKAAQFPPINPGDTEYIIQPDQAVGLVIETLYLPKGFVLKVASQVRLIDWSVNTIKIEEGATFDLAAPQSKPAPAPNGAPPPPRQAGYCITGVAGNTGQPGVIGVAGTALNIHDIETIENVGSLWVRTDSGPGGDGGNGGGGQYGGGPRKSFGHKCNSAPGGSPGPGGAGGPGGATSQVKITFKSNPSSSPITNGIASNCGHSQRPSGAQGHSGVIAIWGASGCPGNKGNPGGGGIHG